MDLTALRIKIVALRRERYNLENKYMARPREMLAGPLIERYAPCGKPNCRCKKRGNKGHGPYYYSQIKLKGAYTNIYLGRNKELIELARRYSEYIKDLARLRQINKEIDRILEEMSRSKLRKGVK